jgi:hypothetical protein
MIRHFFCKASLRVPFQGVHRRSAPGGAPHKICSSGSRPFALLPVLRFVPAAFSALRHRLPVRRLWPYAAPAALSAPASATSMSPAPASAASAPSPRGALLRWLWPSIPASPPPASSSPASSSLAAAPARGAGRGAFDARWRCCSGGCANCDRCTYSNAGLSRLRPALRPALTAPLAAGSFIDVWLLRAQIARPGCISQELAPRAAEAAARSS